VGLTGGIGSGKSTVTARFSALGVPVIDADQVTRALCAPGQPALAEVVVTFGRGVLDGDGRLDRAALRGRVFADPDARRRLEAILHPRVRAALARQAAALEEPYGILTVPLLLESGQVDLVDRVLVVDCPEEVQVRRVVARDSVAGAEVEAVLAAQATRETRLAAADDVVVNDVNLETLYRHVDRLHRRYLALAMEKKDVLQGAD
jgi:dephospho-CoA kinase